MKMLSLFSSPTAISEALVLRPSDNLSSSYLQIEAELLLESLSAKEIQKLEPLLMNDAQKHDNQSESGPP